jgi:hypothetical protein
MPVVALRSALSLLHLPTASSLRPSLLPSRPSSIVKLTSLVAMDHLDFGDHQTSSMMVVDRVAGVDGTMGNMGNMGNMGMSNDVASASAISNDDGSTGGADIRDLRVIIADLRKALMLAQYSAQHGGDADNINATNTDTSASIMTAATCMSHT